MSWHKLDNDWIKLSTDGISKANRGPTVAENLLRDDDCHRIGGFVYNIRLSTYVEAGYGGSLLG